MKSKLKLVQNISDLKVVEKNLDSADNLIKIHQDLPKEDLVKELIKPKKKKELDKWTNNSTFNIAYENLHFPNRQPRVIFYDGKHLKKSKNDIYPEYTFFDFFNDHYSDTWPAASEPHIIITAAGMITHLDKINYKQDIIDHLNHSGLTIYFYESVFFESSHIKREFVNSKPSNNDKAHFEKLKKVIVGEETTNEYISKLYSFELEKVKKFVIRNNLTNVTVSLGEYNIEKYLQDTYPEFTLKTDDIFLRSMFVETDKHDINSFEYNPNLTSPTNETIRYKFWCGNRRYDGYRHLTVAYLPRENSMCSYQLKFEDSPFEIFDDRTVKNVPMLGHWRNHLWFDFDSWDKTYPRYYKKILNSMSTMPITRSLDVDIESYEVDLEFIPLPADVYQKCFCAVVTEAKFAQPFGHITEKTFNAIKCFRPFILVAPPHSLEYLKSFGIETFSEFWDESYDQEENHERRLIKLFQLYDDINSKSVDELKDIYNNIRPILDRNYQKLRHAFTSN